MILCYACRQEPKITALPSSWLKQMQIPAAKHWMEVGESYGRVGGSIEGSVWRNGWTWDLSHGQTPIPDTVSDILYACKQEPSMAVLWEAPPSSWLWHIQTTTAKQWMELVELYGRIRGQIAGLKGDRNSTGRPTMSTTLDPWDYQSLTANQRTYTGWT